MPPAPAGKSHTAARPHNRKAQNSITIALPVADRPPQRPSLLEPTPSSLRQDLLDSFTTAFPVELDPNTVDTHLQPLLQQVKHHLYERDFGAAFSRPEWLRAYAARWSAARALGYIDIFRDVFPLLAFQTEEPSSRVLAVTCLGGGAGAEVAALAAWRAHYNASRSGHDPISLSVTALDVADWSTLLHDLHNALSHVLTQANATEDSFAVESLSVDILDAQMLAPGQTTTRAVASSRLVTLLFTLNELYSTSISKTQKFLLDLTRTMSAGSLLLVVDSPGSYSTVSLGSGSSGQRSTSSESQKQRKYPMSWLLDHALLQTARDVEREARGRQAEEPWEKLEAVESRWFRLSEELRYPTQLENMRYQLHLYRRRPK